MGKTEKIENLWSSFIEREIFREASLDANEDAYILLSSLLTDDPC